MSIIQATRVQNSNVDDKATRRRSKGERTREKILLAAINVLAVNGIKGTTHRAIANYANLQLSLTTYYFKDIHQLVQQAFELNADYLRARTATILDKAFTVLENTDQASLKEPAVKQMLCDNLANMTASYLFENIKREAIPLAVEQLMFTTTPVSTELKKLITKHKESQLTPLTKLARYFNEQDPEIDAKMMHSIFTQLEYSQLTLEPSELSIEPVLEVTKKLLGWIMGLKH